MGVFEGMKEASSTQTSEYIRPGSYLCQIKEVKLRKSRMNKNKEWYIVQLKVLESESVDDSVKPNAVNSEPGWVVELPGKFPELAMGNVKDFLFAAFNSKLTAEGEDLISHEDVDEELADYSYDEEQPLVGVYVSVKAFNKKTKEGKDFTRINWETPDNVEELNAA